MNFVEFHPKMTHKNLLSGELLGGKTSDSQNSTLKMELSGCNYNFEKCHKHKIFFINQTDETNYEREHVEISNAAKFKSC